MLYSTPLWAAMEMVPLGKAQVGCTIVPKIGTAGGVGTALILTLEPVVTQVMSDKFRTRRV